MVLGTVIKYSVPLSFVYCTIYQQNIWREGDEKLILEQKRVWRDFFNMIDCGYYTLAKKVSKDPSSVKRIGLASKFEVINMKSCWNSKVASVIEAVDKAASSKSIDFGRLTKAFSS